MTQTAPLSKREWQVVDLLLEGKSNKLIAAALGISDRTVEFHLKNIYAKQQVGSRIELVLKLGKGASRPKLGLSTVAARGERADNRDGQPARADRVLNPGKELHMKNLLISKHVLVGIVTAFLTGLAWVSLLWHFGHMQLDALKFWVVPLALVWTLIGSWLGVSGKRNGRPAWQVFLASLFGTGAGALAMLPIVGLVLYPLAKLVEGLGWIDRAAIPTTVTTTLATAAMLVVWLFAAVAGGQVALAPSPKKPAHKVTQTPTPQ